MIERNWLLNYATIEGIGNALSGLSRRVKYANRMNEAVKDLQEHYAGLEADFRVFFPELKKEVARKVAV